MEELNNVAVENVSTPDTQPAVETAKPEVMSDKMVNAKPERTYNKQQVTDLMEKRRARTHRAFFNRYGVTNLKGLDELFDKSKKFQSMQDEYGAIQLRNSDLMRENAFLRNNIEPAKYDDIVAHFKGMGQDFTEEALLEAIKTHPEWLKPSNIPAQTTIKSMGIEAHKSPTESDAERASRLLGVNL